MLPPSSNSQAYSLVILSLPAVKGTDSNHAVCREREATLCSMLTLDPKPGDICQVVIKTVHALLSHIKETWKFPWHSICDQDESFYYFTISNSIVYRAFAVLLYNSSSRRTRGSTYFFFTGKVRKIFTQRTMHSLTGQGLLIPSHDSLTPTTPQISLLGYSWSYCLFVRFLESIRSKLLVALFKYRVLNTSFTHWTQSYFWKTGKALLNVSYCLIIICQH